MNTGVHDRSAASATWGLRLTTLADTTFVGDEQPTHRVELWRTLDCAATAASGLLLTLAAGPRRQRSVVQRADGGTRRNPRRRRRTRRLFKHAERRSRNCREGEHRRLAPKDLGGGDRCLRHDLDLSVDARLICVDLQEHIADAQRHALRMRDNDLDLPHVFNHRPRAPTAQ